MHQHKRQDPPNGYGGDMKFVLHDDMHNYAVYQDMITGQFSVCQSSPAGRPWLRSC